MALVFKTPKTAINTTTRDIQNLSADCPPCPECPECPEVELTTAEVEYTENGSFTVTPESGFDGLSQVDITVNIDTQSIADEAYAEGEAAGIVTGKAQGVAEQKAKLTSTTLTTNGTVTREDGWNEVTVDVDTTTPYNEGVAAGIAEQKAKLTSLNVTRNGQWQNEDGYNDVTVNVPLTRKTIEVTSLGSKRFTPSEGGFSQVTLITRAGLPSDIKGVEQHPFATAAEIVELENEGVNFYDMTNEQEAVWILLAGNKTLYGSATFDENNNCVITFDANYPNWPNHRFIVSPFLNGTWPSDFRWDNIGKIKAYRRTVENGITTYNICSVSEYANYNITSNGSYNITLDPKYSTIFVNVPSDVNNQDKTVTPTTSSQSVSADSGYSGLGTVTVEAVTSSIDANIAAGNIKKDVSILGVTGSYDPQPILQEKIVDPTTSQQVITADSGNDGLSQVTVEGVTSAIDANIQPENILEGITILGVDGSDRGYTAGFEEGQASCPPFNPYYLSETITENGSYTFSPSDYCPAGAEDPETGECTVFANAFDGVTIEVNVPSSGSNCPDWSSIGWDCSDVNNSTLVNEIAYTAQKKAEYEAGTISSFANDTNLVYVPNTVVKSNGLFTGCGKITYAPSFTVSTTSLEGMFKNCASLSKVTLFDTSNVTNFTYMFGGDSNYTGTKITTVPLFNTSAAITMANMFHNCISLESIPLFDTSNVTNFIGFVAGCSALVVFPSIDMSNATTVRNIFQSCTAMTTIPQLDWSKVRLAGAIFYQDNHLTELGGFTNFGKAFVRTNSSSEHLIELNQTKATYQSIMNVINNLAAPDDTAVTDATLKLSAASYALLSAEDIAIATAKNWTVVSA